MSDRREFLSNALISCGIVGFTGRTRAFVDYLTALFTTRPHLLPEGWEFYEIGGQVLFPIYFKGGGLSTYSVCYLLQKAGAKHYAIAVSFTSHDLITSASPEAIEHLVAFRLKDAIRTFKPVEVDMNGGSFPLPEDFNA